MKARHFTSHVKAVDRDWWIEERRGSLAAAMMPR
jgi:hypothetical protein